MKNNKVKFSSVVLILIVVLLIAFVLRVFTLIETTGYEPSTLITAVFAAALGEFGILGWIKNTKTKNVGDITTPYVNTDDTEGVG